METVKGRRRRSMMSGGGFLVLVALVMGMAFPYVAVAYAESSISTFSTLSTTNEATPSNSPTRESSGAPSDVETPAPTRDDLGVRRLPLLSDSTRSLWFTDPAAALHEANVRVFGTEDPYWPYHELQTQWHGEWDQIEAIMENGAYVDWLAGAPDLIQRLFEATPPTESDVLDLAGLLIFLDATGQGAGPTSELGPDLQYHVFVAVALLQSAAQTFQTCDSHLAYAHALSLDWVSWSDAAAQFDKALASCQDDPSAEIAKNYWELAWASETKPVGESFDYADLAPELWSPIIDDFRQFQASHPDNPAGWIGEGDTYLSAALQMREQGAQPFAAQAFFQAAKVAYTEALTITTSSDVELSLARVEGFLGKHQEAERMLQELPDTLQRGDHGVSLLREILLDQDDFKRAASVPDADPGTPAAVAFGPWSDFGFDPHELTGQQDVVRVDDLLYSPGQGGGSISWNYGHTPSWRMSEGWAYPFQLDMLVLDQDWGRAQELFCTGDEGYPDYDSPPCLIAWTEGDPDQMGSAEIDYWQNLMRSQGLMIQARELVSDAAEVAYNDPVVSERLGEIEFLEGKWDQAAASSLATLENYDLAAARDGDDYYSSDEGWFRNNTGPAWAGLRYATALRKLGRLPDALDALSSLNNVDDDPTIDFFAEYERAGIAFDKGDYADVLPLIERSIDIGRQIEALEQSKILSGAEAQMAAMAALELGEFGTARDFATQALANDPYNPLFQEALAEAERKGAATPSTEPTETSEPATGSDDDQTTPDNAVDSDDSETTLEGPEAAIEAYRQALALNPSLFSTWNNLGVLLYQAGQSDEALRSFEQAASLRPDYATAWFNVGVVEADRPGFLHFLRSQGALGKAGLLDSGFKDQGTSIAFDEEIYDSGLDLSKQLPENWQLTDSVRSRPNVLAVGILVMVVARVVWALGSSWMVGNQLERIWKNAARSQRWTFRLWTWQPNPLLTSAVTLGALLAVTGATGLRESLFVGVMIVAALVFHAILARIMTNEPVRQGSFLPGSLLTAGLAFVGVGFAPPAPFTAEGSTTSAKAHRSAIAALALVVVTYGLVAWMTGVPTARSIALASMVLISSAMLPIPPLDGSRLELKRWIEVLASLAVGAGTVALTLSVV